MHYLLVYDLAADYLERRAEFRTEHLKLAWEAQERGELVLAGPCAEPADIAVLMFQGESPEVAEKFVRVDPYIKHGLVKSYRVKQWNTVIGELAFNPIRPE